MTFSFKLKIPFTRRYVYLAAQRDGLELPEGAPWFDAWTYTSTVGGARERLLEGRFGGLWFMAAVGCEERVPA